MADILFLGCDSVSLGVYFMTFQRNAVFSKYRETESDTLTFQKNWILSHATMRTFNIAICSVVQVFGLFNTVAYAAGAYFLYVEWKGTRTNN